MTGIGIGTDLGRLQELYRRPKKPFPLERLLEAIAAVEPQAALMNSPALSTIEPTRP
jgi:hypothetical protein